MKVRRSTNLEFFAPLRKDALLLRYLYYWVTDIDICLLVINMYTRVQSPFGY